MATRVVTVELTGIEEMERQLVELVEKVEQEKEKMRDTFQQLHDLFVEREETLLRELDGVVVEARQELNEKREVLQELQESKELAEKKLTKNHLREVLEKHLRNIEDQIQEDLSKPLSVTWLEVEWKKEQLEQSIAEVLKVVKMKERPFRTEVYFLKLRPVWYHESTGSSVIQDPRQLAIDCKSGNIFVADFATNKIQVFDNTGHYLYHIPTPPFPRGLCISDGFIFVTAGQNLLKILIFNKKTIKSVRTEESIYGMDISNDIYGCELYNKSVILFDKNLNFLKRIPLKSHFSPDTYALSIRLYESNMYVMFRWSIYRLQVFSQAGQLIRSVMQRIDIEYSIFFSLDQIGNIIVTDHSRHQIKLFSNSGLI